MLFTHFFDGLLYRDAVFGSPVGYSAFGEYGTPCVAHGLLQRLPERVSLTFLRLQLAAQRHHLCEHPDSFRSPLKSNEPPPPGDGV